MKSEVRNDHGWRSVADPPPEGWWVQTKISQNSKPDGLDWDPSDTLDWCFIHRRLVKGVWEDSCNQQWAKHQPTHWREI